ncbi:MAG: hypothetical protein KJO69_00155 [Gammaproteobacteria bacterium]|nr:hypothetical protein [Gammaproteobacteria bacterium]
MKPSKELKAILKEYKKLATDMEEVRIGADLEWQTERLKKINKRFNTEIHGGGTGED